jgi:DNA-binding SARP family transcriptional activator/TolB-like protein
MNQSGRAISAPARTVLPHRLCLRLLGPLRVRNVDLPVPLPPSRKVRALLGYLALAPRPVLRTQLCELLWDVANDPRSELRWCLTKLRCVLDVAGRRRLIADKQWVSIDASDMDIDAIEFSRSIEQALDDGSLSGLKRLAGMIEGDLLEGLTVDRSPIFDNWLRGQRHRFANWHSQALARIAALLPVDGEDVLAILRNRIDLAPLDEQAHIDLIRALTIQGHVEEAEQHLATTVSFYQREGLDPKQLHRALFDARRIKGTGFANLRRPVSAAMPAEALGVNGAKPNQIPSPPAHSSTRRASVAVMPFAASTAAEKGLADGLAHDIIVGLAKLRSLLVIARGTTFALRDRGILAPEAGALLGVDYVATGTAYREGLRIRVSLELCACESGRIVWADEYDSRVEEALQAPGTIATRIVSCIDAEIQMAECNRAVVMPPNSLDAWEAHHRGLWHMYRFTGPDNDEAQRYFQRSVAIDPTFSRAYAGLSFTHWQNAFTFKSAEKQAEADRAFDAAGRALLADHRDPAAHWAMGRALWLRGEDAASLRVLNEAVSLSPNFAMGHYTLGFVQAQTGDAQAAVLAADVARQLSPFDPMLYAMCAARAFALVRLGRLDEAAEWAIKAARKPNAHVQAHGLAALVLAVAGKSEEALREVGVIRRLRPTYRIKDFLSSYRVLGDQERAYRAAAKRIGIG